MHPIKPIKKQLSIVDLSLWLMMFSPKVSSPYVNLMSQQIRQAASQANSNMYLNSKGMLIQTVLGLPRYTKSLSNSLLSHLRLGRFQEGLWATRLHIFFCCICNLEPGNLIKLQTATWGMLWMDISDIDGTATPGYNQWIIDKHLYIHIYIFSYYLLYINNLEKSVSIRQPCSTFFFHMSWKFSGQTCEKSTLRNQPSRFAPGDMPALEHFKERLRSFKDFRSFQRCQNRGVSLGGTFREAT